MTLKTLIVALYPYNGQGLDSWHDHGAGITYTCAKDAGCDVSFLDMKIVKDDSDLKERLKGYDLVGFGLKSSYYQIGMKVARFAKQNGSRTIIGGYHITAAPNEIEQDLFDYIFHGESELTFPQFLKNPEGYGRHIQGEKVPDLNLLPWIDRTIYRDETENCSFWWHGGRRRRMLSVFSARGCPFRCSFCQPLEDNHFGRKLRRRTVDNLIAEMKWLKDQYSPDCLMIHDDTFFVQPKWVEEFADKYPEIGLPFWAAARADGVCEHPDLVRKLIKVGWELVSIGFESGSQRILDKMKKGTTVEQNYESARIVKEAGGKLYANYILGLPWETRWDIQETMRMADTINAEMPSWAFFTPYPGCELEAECVRNEWSLLNRTTYDRCPSGRKCKNVDYDYVNRSLKGFRETLPRLECDIIIPAYENEDYSLTCIESIKQNTSEGTYRIIFVDNGSKSYQRVEQALSNQDHIFLRLDKNYGFTDAINRGLEISDAPNVCLLNNDTQVSKNWLGKLLKHLHSSKDLGIVGPLTSYGEKDGDSHHCLYAHRHLLPKSATGWPLDKINEELERLYAGKTMQIAFVAFLCAVIKREVIEKVGKLDPRYVFGMWDDNDYNIAVRRAGYRTELAMDTCINHIGRTTFTLLRKTEKFDVNALVRKNKVMLDKKWDLTSNFDTIIVARAIYDKVGYRTSAGVLTEKRLELMQQFFINSLKSQTDPNFGIYLVVGKQGSEPTVALEGLDWSGLNITYVYTDYNLDEWRAVTLGKRTVGKEQLVNSPEEIAKKCEIPIPIISARLDTDDWVSPGWIAHMRRLAREIQEDRFLINYQVIGQDADGFLYQFADVHNHTRISPFMALVQKRPPRISPYRDFHLRMGRYFNSIYTVQPGYVFMVVHGQNRSNRVYVNDKYIGIGDYFAEVHHNSTEPRKVPAITVSKLSKHRIINRPGHAPMVV